MDWLKDRLGESSTWVAILTPLVGLIADHFIPGHTAEIVAGIVGILTASGVIHKQAEPK